MGGKATGFKQGLVSKGGFGLWVLFWRSLICFDTVLRFVNYRVLGFWSMRIRIMVSAAFIIEI